MMTLYQAQRQVEEHRRVGVDCPCCGLFVKVYKRKLNSGMAAALCWLVRNSAGQFVHVNEEGPRYILRRGGEWTLLRYWGLIEEQPTDDSKRTSGLWRPTQLGRDFVARTAMVKSHALCFNRDCLQLVGSSVDIIDCLGNAFSYPELMES